MKNTTAARLQQVMNERNLKQVDVITLSKVHQKELGVKLGKSALSQYINGKSTPDQEKLVLLARTLGVSEVRCPYDERTTTVTTQCPRHR